MPAARHLLLAGGLSLALAVSAAGAAPGADPAEGGAPARPAPDAKPSGPSQGGYRHLKPLLLEADAAALRTGKDGRGAAAEKAADRSVVRADPATHTVTVPVRLTRARGVVEWLLSAGGDHARMSVLVARCPIRALARAMEEAGLSAGRPPRLVGDDAARPPQGPAVRLTLRLRGPDGTAIAAAAQDLLAATPDGTPLPDGRWVYVGPQWLADGKVLLAELSGSLVTTALRDTSALVYWVPTTSGEGPLYVKAVYARREGVPAGVTEAVLEIRPAAPAVSP